MELIKYAHKEDVTIINQNGQLVVTSREIAENFEKRHADVIRTIEGIMQDVNSTQNCVQYFIEDYYKDASGKRNKEYLLTRDGWSLLVMGFTGTKALNWKLKYIDAFNTMEESLKNPFGRLSKEVQAIFALDTKQQKLEKEVKEIKEELPLFTTECKELQDAVRRKGVEVLGGKKTIAYKSNSTRGKVYSDIQQQLKREFCVKRYESIKRCKLEVAMRIVSEYRVPYILQQEIEMLNNQISI